MLTAVSKVIPWGTVRKKFGPPPARETGSEHAGREGAGRGVQGRRAGGQGVCAAWPPAAHRSLSQHCLAGGTDWHGP